MQLMLSRDLVERLQTPNRFKCHFELELLGKTATFLCHVDLQILSSTLYIQVA
jgi:hypothetical protein